MKGFSYSIDYYRDRVDELEAEVERLRAHEKQLRERIEAALAEVDNMDKSVEHHTDFPCPKCFADDIREALTGGREK